MTWQIVPIRLIYYKPKWFLLVQSVAVLMVLFTLLHIISDTMNLHVCSRSHQKSRVHLKSDYKKYLNMTWEAKNEDLPLLTLFTSWNPLMQKPIVYTNAVKNWRSLSNDMRTIVFTNDSDIAEIGKRGNWNVMPLKKTACFGTPVLRGMFEEAMKLPKKSKLYAYSNADLVYNDGLIRTLKEIIKSPHFEEGPLLIVGKRIDVNISTLHEPEVNTTDDVDKLARHGNLSWGFASDFYITNELFPWKLIPDLVIGRPLVDNWLIWFARNIGTKVVDVTGTVLAVHQLANGLKRIHFMCNKAEMWKSNMLPPMPIWKGLIECAAYETKYNSKGEVIVLPKLFLPHLCKYNEVKFGP